MVALSEHPEQKQRLLDDPSLINTAVEEILRWATPVMHFRRQAPRRPRSATRRSAKTRRSSSWHISANRDETGFDDPYTFDVGRSPNEHVAFGAAAPTSAWAPTWPAWR